MLEYISLSAAVAALGVVARLAFVAGGLNQRVIQLEAARSADAAKLDSLGSLLRETHDAVVRLEARQEAYFHMQES